MRNAFLAVSCVLLAGTLAMGDWDPGGPHKMHWPQLPDSDPTSSLSVVLNTGLTVTRILADDWQCNQRGLVTEIHLWGSWQGDVLPEESDMEPDAGLVDFRLTIRADIPAAESHTGYSLPGDRLWQGWFFHSDPVDQNTFTVREYGQWDQGWYDSQNGNYDPSDHAGVWQYNFYVDPETAFLQEEGTIYWFEVMAFPGPDISPFPQSRFGWNISRDHWMDDAVWVDDLFSTGWQELYHPERDESLDMAFVIVPEPGTVALLTMGILALLRKGKV